MSTAFGTTALYDLTYGIEGERKKGKKTGAMTATIVSDWLLASSGIMGVQRRMREG